VDVIDSTFDMGKGSFRGSMTQNHGDDTELMSPLRSTTVQF